MDKKTKIMLGVAAIGVATYLYYQSTKTKNLINATGKAKPNAAVKAARLAAKAKKKNASGAKKGRLLKKKMNITGSGIGIHASQGKFAPTANNKVFNNITGTGIDIHAARGKFNASGMHMMPDGSMMKNSMMNSGDIFTPTEQTNVFNS